MSQLLTVLLVEDDPMDAELMLLELRRSGFDPIWQRVDSEQEYIDSLSLDIQIILSDYSMPEFNAVRALKLMQQSGLEIPFIIVSGTIGEAVAVEAMRAGANDYLMKGDLARLGPAITRELEETHDRLGRRQAEAELRRSEAQYRLLIDTASEGIWIADAGAHITYTNQRLADMLGYTVEEMIGRSALEVLDDDTCAEMKLNWQPRLQGYDEQYDLRLRRKDGSVLWVILSATPIRDERGQVSGALAMLTDITIRKQTEQVVRLQATALEFADNAILISSPEGTITWVNPAFSKLTGYTPEEVLGQNTRILKSGRHDAVFYESMWKTLLSRQVWRGEIINQRKDGTFYFEEQTITPVLNDSDQLTNFVAIKQDITKRKRAEAEKAQLGAQIEDQRRRLNNIVASVPGIVWEAWGEPDSATQRIDFVSDYVETMLGYSVDEWLAIPNFWLSIVHPDDKEQTARGAAANFASRKSSNTQEFRWVGKDGRVLWVQANSAVITDDERRPVGLRGVTIDITERKRAEGALRKSEERYRLLFASNPLPMWVYDLMTLGFLEVNDAAVHHYGYSREEFLSMSIREIRPSEDVATLMAGKSTPSAGSDETGILRHLKKDGRIIDVEIKSHQLIFAGRPAQLVLAYDITERKRAEESVKQAEEKYRSIFENALEGIFQSNPHGKFISVNPSMVRILGYESPEELIAHRTDMGTQHYVDAESRCELEKKLAEQSVVVGYECEVYRKDLSKIWTVKNVRAIRDKNGAVLYYEGSIEDITERKTLEEQLRQSQKLEGIGMLAGGIAHDFNNLLTVISGYSDLALKRLGDDDPTHRNITEVKNAAERAAGLTRQLLAFSRKQVLQLKALNLNAIVSEVEKLLRRLIGEDIEFMTVLGSDLGTVKADPGQIEQIVMNLAINARDAMPRGGKLTIETKNVHLDAHYAKNHITVIPGPYVMLATSDNGTGMDRETQSRIFEPFFTTKEVGKGTGLGLSTVYGIVKQSGGNIWVYSEVGRGTTFKVYLPQVEEAATPYKDSAETSGDVRGAETILLAEDQEMLRTLARRVLEMYGYQVLEAANGCEALSICECHEEPIHLLITDVIMPEMGGRELADRVSELRPEMKSLFMSGYTDNAMLHHGVLNEGTNFIQKPFSTDALVHKVREILDARKEVPLTEYES